ncbi:MAG: bifunctional glutamate N-acetyltransferase/amino-acid acetyltransferase ArgJ [Rhodomicrobium sp.]
MAQAHKVSKFAPAALAQLPPLPGVRLAVAEAGIKYANRKDVLFALFPEGTQAGGVLTRSKTASAPVEWCRTQLHHGKARALVVNSGNANAFTGWRGRETVTATADFAAKAAECLAGEVYIASTGVIGEPLEASKFAGIISKMAAEAKEDCWLESARAIMTTDTFPKLATRRAHVGGVPVTLNGIAKGSGMIAPDMATMLSFIATDAAIDSGALTKLCRSHIDRTFNAITVDSDTSTSDTLLVFATGTATAKGASRIVNADDPDAAPFSAALLGLMHDLSLQVVKDGEGISKLMIIHVEGAENDEAARRIGLSIGNSPLVKTAIAGEDANWGRIVAAVGKTGEAADRDRLSIWFGDISVAREGMRDPNYKEKDGAEYVKGNEIEIRVNVGTGGGGRATVWASDLTHDYIAINADYRS